MEPTIISPICFDPAQYEATCRLLKQLTARNITLTEEAYDKLITSTNSRLFFVQHNGCIAGMITVGTYLSPTGSKAWIEDVVVDEGYRGYGLGRQLVAHAIDYCRKQDIETLYLTSNPKRVAANGLYQSIGFERKETNMYKLQLTK